MKKIIGLLLMCGLFFTFSHGAQADLDDGLVAFYPFNGNTLDESGNNNHGVAHGAALAPDRHGIQNSVYSFDGMDDYVDIGYLSDLNGATSLTVSVWINQTALNRVAGFVGKWYSGPGINNTFLLYNGEGSYINKGAFCIDFSDGSGGAGITGNNAFSPSGWTHVVGVWRGSDGFMAIYKNGILDNSYVTPDAQGKQLNYHEAYTAKIGNWGILHGGSHWHKGFIDEVRIYNRALSEKEIYTLAERNPCAGDLDRDGDVDSVDLAAFAKDFGRTNCETEVNGIWTGDELNGQAGNWGFLFSCNGLDIISPQDGEWYRGTFTLNRLADPYQIDYYIIGSNNPGDIGKISKCIYTIEGDTLTIAVGEPGTSERPTDFIPNGTRVFVLDK